MTRPESKLIAEIVNYIFEKLNHVFLSDSYSYDDGLVGIDSRVRHVESLLCPESADVRVVGIWGMGGIGKTTIARKVFDKIYGQFTSQCFLANVRERLEKGILDSLQSEFFSKLLGIENLNNRHSIVLSSFNKRRLSRRKVLIVLDDVSDLEQMECLIGNFVDWGLGSRIIITSRDKQLLKNKSAKIYEVEKLNDFESLRLFWLHAFKQNVSKEGYMALSYRAIDYAQGIPLALKVLGSNLQDKSVEEWEDELDKPKGVSDEKIQKILRISYDGLSEKDKDIFLDIACFFNGEDKKRVVNILDVSGSKIGISRLADRSLISIENGKIHMHDLLRQMGKDIVCKEKQVGKRRWLWKPKDIRYVLTRAEETEVIKGISLDMSRIKEIELSPTVFEGMYNLRFLKFYCASFCSEIKLQLPRGLNAFPDELKLLDWHQYPLKFLPSSFCSENLVELHMRCSQLTQLWNGVQELGNLKLLDLSFSKDLMRIPDLSTASNIEVLTLRGCGSITEFPKIPYSITHLDLEGTGIKQVPSSIGCLSYLSELNLGSCIELESLPDTICNLKYLKSFYISGCVNLLILPDNLGSLESLWLLSASSTSIKELPSSISQLIKLNRLDFNGCEGLIVPTLTTFPVCLTSVHLGFCGLSVFPNSICYLESLEWLYLCGNNFESIPDGIKQLYKLVTLNLNDCKRLKYLPELSPDVNFYLVKNCTCLKSAAILFHHPRIDSSQYKVLEFDNCINLDRDECNGFLDNLLAEPWEIDHDFVSVFKPLELRIPGSELPQRMKYKNNSGSSLDFSFTQPHQKHFTLCAVFDPQVFHGQDVTVIGCTTRCKDEFGYTEEYQLDCVLRVGQKYDLVFDSKHVILWRWHCRIPWKNVDFQFFATDEQFKYRSYDAIVKCGVDTQLEDEDEQEQEQKQELIPLKKMKCTKDPSIPSQQQPEEEPPLKRLKHVNSIWKNSFERIEIELN